MGCFDGAGVCELVGTYSLAMLSRKLQTGDFGLYRDDGLGVVQKVSGHQADRLRKDIIHVVFRRFWTQNNDTNKPESCRLSGRDNELVYWKVPALPKAQ